MIKARIRKRDGRRVYDVRLRDPSGKEYERTFLTKREAEAFQDSERASRRKGAWVDPRLASTRFKVVADDWLTSDPAKRTGTARRDRGIVDRHILPVFGDKPISAITKPEVQKLVNTWVPTHKPRTVARMYAVLRAVMTFAFESDMVGRNPCHNIKLPEADEVRRPVLDGDQLDRLTEGLGADQAVMMHVALVLGPRWAEVAGLTVGSINFLGGELSVIYQIDPKGNLVRPKSKAGIRTISAPLWLMDELSDLLARRGLTGADPDALVFVAPEGGPLRYNNWRRRVWLPAVERAGLKGLGFHDLRSNNATALVAEGVDVKVAQQRLGHTDPRVTLGIYARATSDADRQAAERVGERFRPRERRRITGSRTASSH